MKEFAETLKGPLKVEQFTNGYSSVIKVTFYEVLHELSYSKQTWRQDQLREVVRAKVERKLNFCLV